MPAPEQGERAVGLARDRQQSDLAREGIVSLGHGVVMAHEHFQALDHGRAAGFVLHVEFVEEARLLRVQLNGLLQAGDGFGNVLLVLRVGQGEVAVDERERIVAPAGFLPNPDGVFGLVVVEQAAEQIRGVGALAFTSMARRRIGSSSKRDGKQKFGGVRAATAYCCAASSARPERSERRRG